MQLPLLSISCSDLWTLISICPVFCLGWLPKHLRYMFIMSCIFGLISGAVGQRPKVPATQRDFLNHLYQVRYKLEEKKYMWRFHGDLHYIVRMSHRWCMVFYRISMSLEVFTAPSPSCVVSMGPSRLIEREIGPNRHAAWHGWGVASPSRMPRCLWLRQSCKVRLLEAQMTSSNKKTSQQKRPGHAKINICFLLGPFAVGWLLGTLYFPVTYRLTCTFWSFQLSLGLFADGSRASTWDKTNHECLYTCARCLDAAPTVNFMPKSPPKSFWVFGHSLGVFDFTSHVEGVQLSVKC